MNSRKGRIAAICFSVIAIVTTGVGCSDVGLTPYVPLNQTFAPNNKFTLEGDTCSDPADVKSSKLKQVYIIDNSLSNVPAPIGSGTDPLQAPCGITPNPFNLAVCNNRYYSILNLMQTFYDPQEGYDPNKEGIVVEFNGQVTLCGKDLSTGMINSSSSSHFQVPNISGIGFAKLGDLLQCLIPNKDGTEWTETGYATLAMQDIVENTVAGMTPLEALQTTVQIFLVSDGVPDDSVGLTQQPPLSFYENVDNIVDVWDDVYSTFSPKLRKLEFFVLQYGYNVLQTAPVNLQNVADLLGNGITNNNTRGQYIPVSTFDPTTLTGFLSQEFTFKKTLPNFFVYNESGRVRVENNVAAFLADSDGDGLTDEEEVLQYGTDPNTRDSDDDDMSDFDEIQLGSNPHLADGGNCTVANGTLDSDKDGLTDCAELLYGTSSAFVDTDGDGIPDRLEVLNGLNPLLNDANDDPDHDGVSNIVEVLEGTPVDFANDEVVNSLKLNYDIFTYDVGNRVCMNFKVSNISTAVTAADPSGETGINYIKAMSKISTFNDALSVVWRQVTKQVQYTGDDKIPASAKITVDKDEFQ